MTDNQHDARELTRAIREGQIIPERSREYWGKEEREQMVSLYDDGVGISEIAQTFQRSEMAVIQQLITMNLLTSPIARRNRKPREPHCLCEQCRFAPCGGAKCPNCQEAAYA